MQRDTRVLIRTEWLPCGRLSLQPRSSLQEELAATVSPKVYMWCAENISRRYWLALNARSKCLGCSGQNCSTVGLSNQIGPSIFWWKSVDKIRDLKEQAKVQRIKCSSVTNLGYKADQSSDRKWNSRCLTNRLVVHHVRSPPPGDQRARDYS